LVNDIPISRVPPGEKRKSMIKYQSILMDRIPIRITVFLYFGGIPVAKVFRHSPRLTSKRFDENVKNV